MQLFFEWDAVRPIFIICLLTEVFLCLVFFSQRRRAQSASKVVEKMKKRQAALVNFLMLTTFSSKYIIFVRIREFFKKCNRPFPSSCLPPLQSESKCEVFVVKISFRS